VTFLAWQQAGKGLTAAQRSVRERFQEGGSGEETLLVLLILAAAVSFAFFLNRVLQRKRTRRRRALSPQQLFENLLGKLNLTEAQRKLLSATARDLGLKDPAMILLSPTLFDRHAQQWQNRRGPSGGRTQERHHQEIIAQARRSLFPRG